MLGHEVGGLRLPLIEANEEELQAVRAMLVRHGLTNAAGEPTTAAANLPRPTVQATHT
jgi:hypothetical protein